MRAVRIALIAGAVWLGLLSATQAGADPTPVKPVDPQRYAGRWYEVARLPNKIQSDCAAGTSDWYRHPDGGFDVVQTCYVGSPNGTEKVWRGFGRIIDAVTNSKFRIGFFGGLVQKDYWVIDRADDYSWCLLSMPNPKFLWIMSREPNLSDAQKQALVAHARGLGFDTSKLVFDQPKV